MIDWITQFPVAITLIDSEGRVLEMNDRAALAYAADGGRKLIGLNSLDCHPEQARQKLLDLLQSQQANVYTIEKAGRKKLILQSPWYEEGQYRGIVEMQIELPPDMPHFVRD